MPSFLQRLGRSTCSVIRLCDLFGTNIKVFFRRRDTVQTNIGGCTTIIAFSLLFCYFVMLALQLYRREEYVINSNIVTKDVTNDFRVHKPAQKGFAVAFGFAKESRSDPNILDTELLQYFEVNVVQVSTTAVNGITKTEFKPLELVKCGYDYPYDNKTALEALDIINFA